MATLIGVGESREIDSFKAGKEAAEQAMEKAGIKRCDFVFLFATVGYEQNDMLEGVRSVTGEAPLSGCSGEGIITQSGSSEEVYRVGVMVISSDEIQFSNSVGLGVKKDSKKAGETIGRELMKAWPREPLVLMMFPDGLAVNTKSFFAGVDSVVEKPIAFTGGLSADNWKMLPELNWQYHNDQILHDAIPCVLISGKAQVEIGVSHGCIPLGVERTITKAEANRIYEIDGRLAFEVFKEYSDEEVTELTPELVVHLCYGEELPDGVATEYNKYIIRTPLTHNKEDGSVTIPTEMSTGTKFYMTRRDPQRLISEIQKTAERIKTKLGGKKPKAVFHFDCAGRGKIIFGRDTKKEVDAVQDVLGKDIPWLGFYCYGEIAPIGGKNFFHNYTAALCILY